MSRLRVTLCTHLFPSEVTGLSGPWVAEQADALAGHADISVLACLRQCRPRVETRESGVRVFYRPTAVLPGTGRAALLAAAVRYRVIAGRHVAKAEQKPGLLHAHFGFPDAVVVADVAQHNDLPWVATLHGDDAFFLLARQDLLGRMMRRALSRARAVVCVSDAMADAVRAVMGESVRIATIENGYNDKIFRLNTEPRAGGLLFVGTLTPVKNVDVLLQAYATLVEAPPLTIVGDGYLRRELEGLAAELGLSNQVTFTGECTREETAAIMRDAQALVMPSASEGFGLAAAEALACGTPVVAAAVGGLKRIVGSPDAGVLVQPGSVDALADGMAAVLNREWDPGTVAASSPIAPWSERALELLNLYESSILRHACVDVDTPSR